MTLVPFFKIGFTNCDDLDYYITCLMGKNYSEMYAQHAGRFYFLITQPCYRFAYLFDNFYFTKVIQYGFLLLSFVLFAVVVRKIFKQIEFALIIFLLLLVFLTVTPIYNMAIITYPFYFTFSFSIFLLSLLALIKYYETIKYKYLVLSVCLSAMALLFYENYLTFILFVILFILAKNSNEQGIKFLKNKKTYKEVLPFVLICITYIVIYFAYRMSIQTEKGFYAGTTFAENFSISNFFTTLYSFNGAVLPAYIYHHKLSCLEANSLLVSGHHYNFLYVFINSLPSSIVNALIQCFLFCVLFTKIKPIISWKKIGACLLISLILLFAVHALIGLGEKYNHQYYRMDGYVTTYYSYFFMTAIIAIIAYASLKISFRNKYAKVTVVSIFTLFFFYISVITNYANDHFSRDWQLSHGKQIMMEKVIQEGAFDIIPDNAIIFMDNYNHTSSKFGHDLYGSHSNFWHQYITTKTKRPLIICFDFENFKKNVQTDSTHDIYFFTKYEAQKSTDILLILSKINNNSIDYEDSSQKRATANEATVYYYSAYKEFTLLFTIPHGYQNSSITINDETFKISCGINALRIVNENKKKEITSFTLKADVPFLVHDFAVSQMGSLNEAVFICNKKQ